MKKLINNKAKIGIFDSGLGGLFTMKAIAKELPEYDYVYLGDTKRLPYGSRSHEVIYQFLKEGVDFLFSKDCAIIIVACNTASAEALRQIQKEYLPKAYPDRKVLGMIVPMTEACNEFKNVGLVATGATIASGAYPREFKKRNPKTKIIGLATPLLVPIVESGEKKWIKPVLAEYMKFLKNKKIDALLLGCTHYAIFKKEFSVLLPKGVTIISQDVVVPKKVKNYLSRHKEISDILSFTKHGGKMEFYVTDTTTNFQKMANLWFGKKISIKKVVIE